MSIGLVDIFIVLFILMGAIVGFKNGAIKEGTKFIGVFVVIIVSFMLKDQLMVLFYENLPFFNFFGVIRGIDAINILLYQLLAFLVIFMAFMFVLKVLVVITGLVEWLLKLTVFLSIPSKIIGIFVGVLEFYVYLFIGLYVLNMPVFNLTFVSESKFGTAILENTPVLSDLVDDTVEVYSDVWNIIKNKDENNSNKEINTLVLATLLDNELITIDSARKLVESNKIIIEDASILDQYDDDESFFKNIGGCAFIGGCEDDANRSSKKEDIITTTIYSVDDETSMGEIKVTINFISDEKCVANRSCKVDARMNVGVHVSTNSLERDYILMANGKYKLIKGTDYYIFARIEDGCLVIGIAE